MGEKEDNLNRIKLKYQKQEKKEGSGVTTPKASMTRNLSAIEDMEAKLTLLYDKIRNDEQTEFQKYKNKVKDLFYKIGVGEEPEKREIREIFEDKFTLLENLAQEILDDARESGDQNNGIKNHLSGIIQQIVELSSQYAEIREDSKELQSDKDRLAGLGITSTEIENIPAGKLYLVKEYRETRDSLKSAINEMENIVNNKRLLNGSYAINDFYSSVLTMIENVGDRAYRDITTTVTEMRNIVEYSLNSKDMVKKMIKAEDMMTRARGYLQEQTNILALGSRYLGEARVGKVRIFEENVIKNVKKSLQNAEEQSNKLSSDFFAEWDKEMQAFKGDLGDDYSKSDIGSDDLSQPAAYIEPDPVAPLDE